MFIAKSGLQLREFLITCPGKRVLVPTMGALHRGHLELIRMAREAAGFQGTIIVSIFVNPIQFDRALDLASYPRPLEADLVACAAAGVDVVFTPETASMYFPDRSVTVTETLLSNGLCGASRAGHFDGVCTVVLKLFLLSACDAAVFGAKDFQQLAIIRRMVRDLNVPVEVIECPTVREDDGLALSSRNIRLSSLQRADAPRLRRALQMGVAMRNPGDILEIARAEIEASDLTRIDYLMLVDVENLQPLTDVTHRAILATAVFYGEVRLIDHLRCNLSDRRKLV